MTKVIKLHVSTGWANGDHKEEMELPDNWDEMTEDDQEKFLNEVAMEYLHECCESAAWVDDSDED